LPRIRISLAGRSRSLRAGSPGWQQIPASSDRRMPVAVSTAMIAASRRAANGRPWQAFWSSDSSPLVKTGTAVTVTFGARSAGIGR
jgi:hypothetical protein